MVEKNMKEEEEPGLEERRAREQLGEGVEVRLSKMTWRILSMCKYMYYHGMVFRWARLIWSGEQTTPGIRSLTLHFTSCEIVSCILLSVKSYLALSLL